MLRIVPGAQPSGGVGLHAASVMMATTLHEIVKIPRIARHVDPARDDQTEDEHPLGGEQTIHDVNLSVAN